MGNKTTDGGGGGSNNPPEQQPEERLTWESAKDDPEKLAQLSGMIFFTDPENGDYIFTDPETTLELRIEASVLDKHSNDRYLNQIVRDVSELPYLNKVSTPEIWLVDEDRHSVLGVHATGRRNGLNTGDHVVAISTASFRKMPGESLMRTLLHETEHAHDYMVGDGTSRGGISNSKTFRDALKKDGPATLYGYRQKLRKLKNGTYKELADSTIYRKNSSYLLENYAESASIVKLQMMGRGSEKIMLPNHELVTVDDWCKNNPNLYKAVAGSIYDSEIDFKKPDNYVTDKLKRDTRNHFIKYRPKKIR